MKTRLGLAALVMMLAACGGGGSDLFGASTSSAVTTGPATTTSTASTTVAGATTSTAAPGSTTTSSEASTTTEQTTTPSVDGTALIEEFLTPDFSEVGPPAEPITGADAVVGGSPNTTAARAVTAALEDAGFDLTGLGLYVLPVTGSPDWLLVLETSDDTALADDEAGGSDQFVSLLMDQMRVWGITRLAVNYEGADAQGPLVMTLTMTLADLEAAVQSGASIEEFALMQIVRPGS